MGADAELQEVKMRLGDAEVEMASDSSSRVWGKGKGIKREAKGLA